MLLLLPELAALMVAPLLLAALEMHPELETLPVLGMRPELETLPVL